MKSGATNTAATICRSCHARCPATVTLLDGEPVKLQGNKNSPLYGGFFCTRGQAMIEQLQSEHRLLHPLKLGAGGVHARIAPEEALDEIAAAMRRLIDGHGLDSIAFYVGTQSGVSPSATPMMTALLIAIGTPMMFSTGTIDQPGKHIAYALAGSWDAGIQSFAGADTWMLVGSNPLVALGGTLPSQNPARRLKDALNAGLTLLVIDPRETETAKRAWLHIQPRPGQDAALLAAMIHVTLSERLYDSEFVRANVRGVEQLKTAVAEFTPDEAARRADVRADDIVLAARTFAAARRGVVSGATGANMSGRSTLTGYMIHVLNILCGRFVREGEAIANPGVLLPRAIPKAQPRPPHAPTISQLGLSVRNLSMTPLGMPTAALADEILSDRIKALVSLGGNPVAALPDQARTVKAFRELELFVQLDIRMSVSAKLAHYVLPPRVSLEAPACSLSTETMDTMWEGWSFPEPFGMYAPALVDAPEESELIDEWEVFYELAKRLGLQLVHRFTNTTVNGSLREPRKPVAIDMTTRPTSESLIELLTRGSRVPLDEVKRHPDGAIFPETIVAAPKDADCAFKMDVGAGPMMQELGDLAAESAEASMEYPMTFIGRRLPDVYNSSGRDLPTLTRKGRTYNVAYMNPLDMERLGLTDGSPIVVRSRHGEIESIAETDETLRPGLVSMAHCFGDLPGSGVPVRLVGSNTSLLTSVEDGFDRFSGIPRMSGLPVSVSPLRQPWPKEK